MRSVLLLLTIAAGCCGESILIRNVTVHPVSSADVPNASVLIVDGKIADIGPVLQAPAEVKLVDGKGLHLYPGLINAATNVGLAEIESLRDSVDLDEIGLFNPDLRAAIGFNPSSEHVAVTRASGITSVLTLPGSGERQARGEVTLITGQAALMHLDGWTWEQMAVKSSAVMEAVFPEIEKVSPRLATFPGTPARSFTELEADYKQQIRELHEFFEDARRYATAKEAGLPDFRPDIRLEAMIPVLQRKTPLFVRAGKERSIKDAVQFADDEKIRMILADPVEIGSAAALLKSHDIPVVLGETFRLPEHDDDAYDEPYTLPNTLFKAGVKICFGTFDVQFARNVPFQAAQAVAFGLPHDEALKALTVNSAEILGVGDRLGSIEKGKIADLILTDGDPMEAKTSIKAMFINGKAVSLESRHTREYERWLARP